MNNVEAEMRELLDNFNPQVQELALHIRKRILDIAPDAEEKVYKGWESLRYGFRQSTKDQFAAIELLKERVNLEFPYGVDLTDSAGILEGTGKRFRHIKIHNKEIAESKEVDRKSTRLNYSHVSI